MLLPHFFTQLQFILLFTIPLFCSPLLSSMLSIDQFSFSSNSLGSSEEFGVSFSKGTGWHYDSCNNSAIEPEWLKKCAEMQQNATISRNSSRYKNDMLDLAPEYAYELSLRDLVELPRVARTARESLPLKERFQKNGLKIGGKEKVKNSRSESNVSGGFLLNMFFPMPRSGKKRNGGSSTSSCGSSKCGGRSISSGSSGSGSSSSSRGSKKLSSTVSPKPLMKDVVKKCAEMQQNATLSRNCSRQQSGCYPFLLNQNKIKTKKIWC